MKSTSLRPTMKRISIALALMSLFCLLSLHSIATPARAQDPTGACCFSNYTCVERNELGRLRGLYR